MWKGQGDGKGLVAQLGEHSREGKVGVRDTFCREP
jgi:hypothetical protein